MAIIHRRRRRRRRKKGVVRNLYGGRALDPVTGLYGYPHGSASCLWCRGEHMACVLKTHQRSRACRHQQLVMTTAWSISRCYRRGGLCFRRMNTRVLAAAWATNLVQQVQISKLFVRGVSGPGAASRVGQANVSLRKALAMLGIPDTELRLLEIVEQGKQRVHPKHGTEPERYVVPLVDPLVDLLYDVDQLLYRQTVGGGSDHGQIWVGSYVYKSCPTLHRWFSESFGTDKILLTVARKAKKNPDWADALAGVFLLSSGLQVKKESAVLDWLEANIWGGWQNGGD
jgi:hypothetical protein